MRKTVMIVLMIALMFGATPFLFAGSVSATTTSTPTWQVGDKWALAGSKDVGVMYSSLDENYIKHAIFEGSANSTMVSSSANGTLDANIVFEVMAATSTEYTLKVTYGANMYLSLQQKYTADMPVAGHYYSFAWDHSGKVMLSEAQTERKTLEGSIKAAAGTNGTVILTLQKSDMAIKQIKIGSTAYVKASASVTNFPNTEYGYSTAGTTVNITYTSLSANVDAHAVLSAVAKMDEPMDILPDGEGIGDDWTFSGIANMTGAVSGNVDVTGIPQQYKTAVDMYLAEYDISGFPIDLTTFSADEEGFTFSHGSFVSTEVPMGGTLSYTRNKMVADASGNQVSAMCLVDPEESGSIYVDPSNHHILATEEPLDVGDTQLVLSLHAVSVATAESGIADAEKQVSDRSTADQLMGGSTGSDNLMLYVLLIIVVVVIAMVAVLLIVRRKK